MSSATVCKCSQNIWDFEGHRAVGSRREAGSGRCSTTTCAKTMACHKKLMTLAEFCSSFFPPITALALPALGATGARVSPLGFQLYNFSGHFKAAPTPSGCCQTSENQCSVFYIFWDNSSPVTVTTYCINFVIFYVILK